MSKPVIAIATLHEFCQIMAEPRLLSILPVSGATELAAFYNSSELTFYIIRIGKYSCLFTAEEKQVGRVAFHIACPVDSIPASRLLASRGLVWVARVLYPESEWLYTTCPAGKIANFVRKLGGKQVGSKGDLLLFAAPASICR